MAWVETIVCSGRKGSGETSSHVACSAGVQTTSTRCIGAWIGTGAESNAMLLVQSAFHTAEDWKRISQEIQSSLDVDDGGIEGLLLGPPLVGIFEIPDDELQSMSFDSTG